MALTVNNENRPRVDTNAAQTTLMNEVNRIRDQIIEALRSEGLKDFVMQNRLMADLQAHVHALDVLEKSRLDKFVVQLNKEGSAAAIGEAAVAKAIMAG